MAPGPTRTADIDRSRLSDGIFLLVGCACDGNDNSDPLCHHDIAAGNRDRRCEHGSGFADQALCLISQLARAPELLFDAAIDRISNRRWRNCPCLLLSSLQSRLARAPASERPPLLVKSHGGPTTATDSALALL